MTSHKQPEEEKTFTATATWKAVPNPLYWVECPHCKKTIIMGQPNVVERLKRWARELLN